MGVTFIGGTGELIGYTADLATSGQAIKSTEQGGTEATKAFDDNAGTRWLANDGGAANGVSYIGQDFGSGVTKHIRRVTLLQANASNDVSSVKIEHSDDGSAWTTLSTHAVANGANTIDLAASAAHRYWRALANADPGGGNNWGVEEVEMMEGVYD